MRRYITDTRLQLLVGAGLPDHVLDAWVPDEVGWCKMNPVVARVESALFQSSRSMLTYEVAVDPIDPNDPVDQVENTFIQSTRLRLTYGEPLTNVAFNFDLRRYDEGDTLAPDTEALQSGSATPAQLGRAKVGQCRLTLSIPS